MWWVWAAAWAGYGDAVDGLPSPAERELHMWTDAVRAEPGAFADEYELGGCRMIQFEAGEKQPQAPMAWSSALNDAARFHADDMNRTHRVTHDSSDGTPMDERVARYYRGQTIGENVAGGYGSPRITVLQGWMCSSGHRANIMDAVWEEFGPGVSGVYMTQDFGARGMTPPLITMGVHRPAEPTNGEVTFNADIGGAAPKAVWVVVDGELHAMRVAWGVEDQGVYEATVEVDPSCHQYWFEAETARGVERFPEDGAYGFGGCAYDDAAARWIGRDALTAPGGPLEGVADGTLSDGDVAGAAAGRGCAQAPGGGAALAGLLAALPLIRRRARR